jgi:BON domain-containing protein
MIADFRTSDPSLDDRVVQMLLQTDRRLIGIRAVTIGPGIIHLCGTADSFYLRQRAVEIVRRLPEVNGVSDGIEVDTIA